MRRVKTDAQPPFADFATQTVFLDVGLFLFGLCAITIGLLYIYTQEANSPLAPQKAEPTSFDVSYLPPVGQDEIIIWVNQQEIVYINEKHVHPEDLIATIRQLRSATPRAAVYLVGHPDARFGILTDVHKTLEQFSELQSILPVPDRLYVTP